MEIVHVRSRFHFGISLSLCLIVLMSHSWMKCNAQLGGIAPDNLISTLQITVKLCYFPGVSSERVAWQFIGCYDWAPGKDLFFKCQRQIFNGRLFDSVRNIKQNCKAPQLIPKYAMCLRNAFRKAGMDMNKAVRKLNACQLPLLQNQ